MLLLLLLMILIPTSAGVMVWWETRAPLGATRGVEGGVSERRPAEGSAVFND